MLASSMQDFYIEWDFLSNLTAANQPEKKRNFIMNNDWVFKKNQIIQ